MPAPRPSRRMARSTKSVPPPEADVPLDDVDVVAPADDYAEQSLAEPGEASSGSRRGRAAGKSSRRMAASSGRANAGKRSSGRVVTPEQRAAKRASLMLVVKILLGVVFGAAFAFGVWWLVMREDPNAKAAAQAMTEVDRLIRAIENDISSKAAADAEGKRKEALDLLDKSAELGYAKAIPDQNNPKLASEEYARQASQRKEQLETRIKEAVERVERDNRVALNLRQALAGFGRLPTFTDAELTNFEKDTGNFLENPVMPGSGPSQQYVDEYKTELSTVRVQLSRITAEKARRLAAITDLPVQEARSQAAVLVQQEKFQEALSLIDELQRKYETADFAAVRQYVTDAAKQSWETASSMANENYATYRAIGTTQEMREAALKAAQTRMEQVVERFGIEEYVNKGKEALERYKP